MKPISAQTEVLAVFGDPISQSLSPVMHNGWIEDHGLDAVYVALRVAGDADVFFRAARNLKLKGANVTVPHKEAAARGADHAHSAAANTLRWEKDGSLSAFNTDGAGFIDSLDESAPEWRQRVEKVLILGAGGAAYGIAQALAPYASLTIANRTRARGEDLAAQVNNASAASWDDLPALFAQADLIVQTTTLGMGGAPSPQWPMTQCKSRAIVADIVYKPLETDFLKTARAKGLMAVDGLGMLIHQGARAFELWFGVKPDAKKARARLLAALGEGP